MSAVPGVWAEWAGFLSNVATTCGIPIALLVFIRDRRRERREREIGAYAALSASYNDYLRRCLDNPELAIVDASTLPNEDKKQNVHVNMVMSMLEAAYFMYRDQESDFRAKQWNGWNEYMKLWCQHPEIRKRWPALVEHFDAEFCKHMKSIYNESNKATALTK